MSSEGSKAATYTFAINRGVLCAVLCRQCLAAEEGSAILQTQWGPGGFQPGPYQTWTSEQKAR